MYLPTPCPRQSCGKQTLNKPQKHGSKLLCICDSCKRHSIYIVRKHVDDGSGYEVVPYGGDAPITTVRAFRAPVEIADKLLEEVKRKIEAYKMKGIKRD